MTFRPAPCSFAANPAQLWHEWNDKYGRRFLHDKDWRFEKHAVWWARPEPSHPTDSATDFLFPDGCDRHDVARHGYYDLRPGDIRAERMPNGPREVPEDELVQLNDAMKVLLRHANFQRTYVEALDANNEGIVSLDAALSWLYEVKGLDCRVDKLILALQADGPDEHASWFIRVKASAASPITWSHETLLQGYAHYEDQIIGLGAFHGHSGDLPALLTSELRQDQVHTAYHNTSLVLARQIMRDFQLKAQGGPKAYENPRFFVHLSMRGSQEGASEIPSRHDWTKYPAVVAVDLPSMQQDQIRIRVSRQGIVLAPDVDGKYFRYLQERGLPEHLRLQIRDSEWRPIQWFRQLRVGDQGGRPFELYQARWPRCPTTECKTPFPPGAHVCPACIAKTALVRIPELDAAHKAEEMGRYGAVPTTMPLNVHLRATPQGSSWKRPFRQPLTEDSLNWKTAKAKDKRAKTLLSEYAAVKEGGLKDYTPGEAGPYIPDDLVNVYDRRGGPHPFPYYAARWDLDPGFVATQTACGLERDLYQMILDGKPVHTLLAAADEHRVDVSEYFRNPRTRVIRGHEARGTSNARSAEEQAEIDSRFPNASGYRARPTASSASDSRPARPTRASGNAPQRKQWRPRG